MAALLPADVMLASPPAGSTTGCIATCWASGLSTPSDAEKLLRLP